MDHGPRKLEEICFITHKDVLLTGRLLSIHENGLNRSPCCPSHILVRNLWDGRLGIHSHGNRQPSVGCQRCTEGLEARVILDLLKIGRSQFLFTDPSHDGAHLKVPVHLLLDGDKFAMCF